MKKIGFLSFGHWSASPHSRVRSGADALLQSIELAVAAEEAGADGAYFRVHHFAQQLASPFPLLAAAAARTSRIELGTAVIDMRYENPLYMAEEAAAVDLISGGRLQLGSAGVPPRRSSPATKPSGTTRRRASPTPTWPAGIRSASGPPSPGRAWPGAIRRSAGTAGRSRYSHCPRRSLSESGGVPETVPAPGGRDSRA